MNLICAEDGLSRRVQRNETKLKVRKDGFGKSGSAILCCTAPVTILYQLEVGSTLFRVLEGGRGGPVLEVQLDDWTDV